MRRAKKIALWSLAGLLSAVCLAVLFLAVAGDNFYRWAMQLAIEGATDREVRVDGSFSFDLGWRPTVIVTELWVENAAWASQKEMVRAERIEIQVALQPLFSGILRVPRLVVEGLQVNLERSAQNQRNWIFSPGAETTSNEQALEDFVYPLIDSIKVSDVTVVYRDEKSGKVFDLRLDSLQKTTEGNDVARNVIHGNGSLNDRPFTIDGQLGTAEDAIAARAPFPLEIKLQSSTAVVEISGTVADLPAGHGLDISLRAIARSNYELLRAFKIESEAFGSSQASIHLKGDLVALAAEDIQIFIVAPSGKRMQAEGRITNLTSGEGLELRFAGNVDPRVFAIAGNLPPGISLVAGGVTGIDTRGTLAGSLERLELKDFSMKLQHRNGSDVAFDGSASANLSGEEPVLTGLEATVRMSLPDEELVARALGVRVPALSDLSATAELVWAGDWLSLHTARVEGKALEPVAITGAGKLGRLSGTDLSFDLDAQLDLKGNSASSRPLFYLFAGFSPSQWRVPAAPAAELAAKGDGPAGSGDSLVLQIQQALTRVGADPGATDGIMGPKTRRGIEAYQTREGLPVDGRATQGLLRHLLATAASLARTEPESRPEPVFHYNETVPELGPIAASIKFSFKDEVFQFEDLDINFGRDGAERITIAGMLGSLPAGPTGVLTGVDVAVTVSAPSSMRVVKLLPPDFPTLTDIVGRLVAKGTENELAISDIKASGKGPAGLIADVTGTVGVLSFEKNIEAHDLALTLDARWPDTHSVVDFINQLGPRFTLPDQDVPELGPVQARATLRDPDGTFAADAIEATAGPAGAPLLRVTGGIADLTAFRQIGLAGNLDIPSALLAGRFLTISDGELGSLRGQFQLSDKDGSVGLENLKVAIEDSGLLSLTVDGQFNDIVKGDGLNAAVDLTVPDLAALGRMLEFDAEKLGNLIFDGTLSGSVERLIADGKARLGETNITGSLSGSLAGERPALTARVHSPLFRLADIGLVPHDGTAPEAQTAPGQKPEQAPYKGWLFDETPIPFAALRTFDLVLDVVFDEIEGAQIAIDKAEAKVNLADGELKIAPLRFDFVGGKAEMTLLADDRGERPKLLLQGSADNVDLEKLLSQTKTEVPLGGTMDVIVDLAAQGHSPRELAASLNGNTQLAIEGGQVKTGLLTLTTTNPMRWIFTKSAREGYSKMNCLIVRLDFENGVGTSQALVLDTPSMLAQGEGRIDLRSETMDIHVQPQAKEKRLVEMTTAFSIQGPLSNPSLKVNAAKTGLRAGGEVLLSPINLLGSLLPFVGNGGKDPDNLCLTMKSVPAAE